MQAELQGPVSAHPLSQVTDVLSDMLSDHEEEPAVPAMTTSKSTINTSFSSLRDSQEEPAQVEPEFQILEEPSQQTLDKMVRRSAQ
jgi:hypothetical protein